MFGFAVVDKEFLNTQQDFIRDLKRINKEYLDRINYANFYSEEFKEKEHHKIVTGWKNLCDIKEKDLKAQEIKITEQNNLIENQKQRIVELQDMLIHLQEAKLFSDKLAEL